MWGPSNECKNYLCKWWYEKEIRYIKQPKGFIQISKHNLVYKLNKSLSRLKQSLWVDWYARRNIYLLQNGFGWNMVDTNVYVKRVGAWFVATTMYIDDSIIIANDYIILLPQTNALLV